MICPKTPNDYGKQLTPILDPSLHLTIMLPRTKYVFLSLDFGLGDVICFSQWHVGRRDHVPSPISYVLLHFYRVKCLNGYCPYGLCFKMTSCGAKPPTDSQTCSEQQNIPDCLSVKQSYPAEHSLGELNSSQSAYK